MENMVKITKIKKNEDGTADVTISYGEPFVTLFKEGNPDRAVTAENIGAWCLELLEDAYKGVS